jgi:hypothetical protein
VLAILRSPAARCNPHTTASLRRRLDVEAEERQQAQVKLTAVLTDQRTKIEPLLDSIPPAAPRRSWWRWGRQ